MIRSFVSTWPLFFGMALIMIGNGLQGTLLGVRATIEGFDTATIGLIMSLYYLGFLGGSYYAPKLISQVGHIRVFTALASLASITVLLHGLYPDPWLWSIIRIFTGFSYAGLYIVAESWLSDSSSNKTRGSIFALYQIISFGGMMFGQFFLNLADPSTINLFVISSILVSIALLPICLSSRPAPNFDEPDHLSLKRLYVISPLGLAGVFIAGMSMALVLGLGAVYAASINMTLPQISTFIALFILGGVTAQIPVGWFSDRYDRRIVIVCISLMACITSLVCFAVSTNPYLLNAAFLFFGFFSVPIYGLSMSHINDHLTPRQYVGASSSAILINGVGAAISPLVVSTLMSLFGNQLFFPISALIFLWLIIYSLLRIRKRDAVPLEEQGENVVMPLRPTPISMTITEEGHQIIEEAEKDRK